MKKNKKGEKEEKESDTDSNEDISDKNILEIEFENRKKNIVEEKKLEFNLILSFITQFKTFLEICKKINKEIDFYIFNDIENKKQSVILNCNDLTSSNTNIKCFLYKESFLEFFSVNKFIHFSVNILEIISKIKTSKRNYYFRIYKFIDSQKITISNLPFLQKKINKLVSYNNFSMIPISGMLITYEDSKNITLKKYSKIPIDFFNESKEERLYFKSISNSYIFNINSNIFCKLLSYFNKNKFNQIIFKISRYETKNLLSIKGVSSNNNIEEFTLYDYNNFNENEEKFIEDIEYCYSLSSIGNFIKIKNFNQETNNLIKLKFYKKNLFLESLLSNSGLVSVCLKSV